MKKGMRILGFLVLGLFVVSFLVGVVSAQEAAKDIRALSAPMIDKIQEIFTNAFGGEEKYDYFKNILSPEILFGILIFLIVFAVISRISVFSTPKISIPLAIVVAILAAGFIPIEWIKPMLNQYTSIGILITLAFPLVLIFLFLKDVAPYSRLIHMLIFSVFFVIGLINAIINWSSIVDGDRITKAIYVIFLIINFLMIFLSVVIFKAIWKEEVKKTSEHYNSVLQLINANRIAEAEDTVSRLGSMMTPSQVKVLQNYINAAKKRQ